MLLGIDYRTIIEGEEYHKFIDWCFRYSSCFSLLRGCSGVKDSRTTVKEDLSLYLILKQKTEYYDGYDSCFREGMKSDAGRIPTTYLYCCCEESQKRIQKESDSLFGWKHLPLEDICFYRDDHTTLLQTVSHEGICWISCTKEEYNRLPNKERWDIQSETEIDSEWYF